MLVYPVSLPKKQGDDLLWLQSLSSPQKFLKNKIMTFSFFMGEPDFSRKIRLRQLEHTIVLQLHAKLRKILHSWEPPLQVGGANETSKIGPEGGASGKKRLAPPGSGGANQYFICASRGGARTPFQL